MKQNIFDWARFSSPFIEERLYFDTGYTDINKISKDLNISNEEVFEIIQSGYKPKMIETFNSVAGTKGFLWKLWSEYEDKNDIDIKYYEDLVADAVRNIYNVGDGDIIFGSNKWDKILVPELERGE